MYNKSKDEIFHDSSTVKNMKMVQVANMTQIKQSIQSAWIFGISN